MQEAISYLPSLEWYRRYVAWRLGVSAEYPTLPKHFCRAEIVAPFGRRTLSVAVEGGRKIISPGRYFRLALSDHGNWPHTHWSTIASAYGGTPYFHLYEAEFESLYMQRFTMLSDICHALHNATVHALNLDEILEWTTAHPEAVIIKPPVCMEEDPSLSLLHTLFHEGPATIFRLLPF